MTAAPASNLEPASHPIAGIGSSNKSSLQAHDFVLLEAIGPEQAQVDFDHLKERASRTLNVDLGAMFQAFGPEDFS
jgi:hypothetical protein